MQWCLCARLKRLLGLYLTFIVMLSGVPFICPLHAAEVQYTITDQGTDIRLLVYKQGALQLFGHNHVIRSLNSQGKIILDTVIHEKSSFHLSIPVAKLVVDQPEDRIRSGAAFANRVDTEAAQATRVNLMGQRLLHASVYPDILIAGGISDFQQSSQVRISITIKGLKRDYHVPVDLLVTDNILITQGRFTVRQSDFALQPMSLMGGLLSVRDDVDVVFKIRAEAD
jgi:polyisoprenoid-binding protein YceI